MADTYRAWLRGAQTWQTIAVIDLRDTDGIGKRLQAAGLSTLGEIDKMEGPELLARDGIGIGVLRRVRRIIRDCKAAERQRKHAAAPARLRKLRTFPS
ncbi:hypothetical protein DevBK_05340 [Devosia sp. BK]|uniref:hypothetical protein n=1 Tax=unclassified Devosia TaxID=196773 RepID=UPI0007148781|nr:MULTISPECIES: hypothetical protein [unclassified Devosia]KQT51279.1 hypothetical protein ASG47_19125 [Devosia sp. Leaf420]MDV3250754.1 hypothetical protein [Devosia sp. BK]